MLKLGSKADVRSEQKCIVRLLDDDEVLECGFQPHHKGQFLIDAVCQQLNLLEKDYFGLRYVDHHKQRHWLDPTKHIMKQVKSIQPIVFCFRVKFYPHDPYKLVEELTRYHIFQQLRRDLQHGRLYCTQVEAQQLATYIVQSELGDYDPDEHIGNYISGRKLLLKQTEDMENEIMKFHKTLKGQVPATAETNFLRKACLLDTYGVDPHPVKDHKGMQLYLGINHTGILTFQGAKKTHHFRWAEIQKINYEGKMFIVHLTINEKKHTVGFKCPSASACRHVWRCAVEQRLFFTLSSSSAAPPVVTGGGFFSRGSKFRYSGRTERELQELSVAISRDPPLVRRNSSIRRRGNSMPPGSNHVANGLDLTSSRPNHTSGLTSPDEILCGDAFPLNCPYTPGDASKSGTTPSPVPPPTTTTATTTATTTSNNTSAPLTTVAEDSESRKTLQNSLLTESPVHVNRLPKQATLRIPDIHCNGELIVPRLQDSFEDIREEEYLLPLPKSLEVGDSPRVLNHTSAKGRCAKSSLDDMALPDHIREPLKPLDLTPLPAPRKQKKSLADNPLVIHLRSYGFVRVFLPAFAVVVVLFLFALILVFETDLGTYSGLKKSPDMFILRRSYYEPVRKFILRLFGY